MTEEEKKLLAAISLLQLIKPGDTRFASALTMIKRVLKVRAKLEQYVVSDEFRQAVSGMRAADKVRRRCSLCSLAAASMCFEPAFSLCWRQQPPKQ
jgi:hypothetical protein